MVPSLVSELVGSKATRSSWVAAAGKTELSPLHSSCAEVFCELAGRRLLLWGTASSQLLLRG